MSPSLSTSDIESGKESGDCVVWESSGDLIDSIGSPLLGGIAGQNLSGESGCIAGTTGIGAGAIGTDVGATGTGVGAIGIDAGEAGAKVAANCGGSCGTTATGTGAGLVVTKLGSCEGGATLDSKFPGAAAGTGASGMRFFSLLLMFAFYSHREQRIIDLISSFYVEK